MSSYLLQEAGDRLTLEDGSGALATDITDVVGACDVLAETGEVILLEDGTELLLDGCGDVVSHVPPGPWGRIIPAGLLPDDDDEAIAIAVALLLGGQ